MNTDTPAAARVVHEHVAKILEMNTAILYMHEIILKMNADYMSRVMSPPFIMKDGLWDEAIRRFVS